MIDKKSKEILIFKIGVAFYLSLQQVETEKF